MDSPVYDGKVYVVRIKATNEHNWEAEDIIHAVAYKGNGGLDFNGFKTICEKNKKWFVSMKANTEDEKKCSQSEIETALQDFPAIGKQQLILLSPVATFFELANLAYQEKIFNNQEGMNKLNEIAKKVKKQSRTSEKVSGTCNDAAAMIEKAKKDAEKLAKEKKNMDTKAFSQGGKILANVYEGGMPDNDLDLNEKTKDDLIALVVDLRAHVVATNEQLALVTSQAATKDSIITDLENRNIELDIQLKEARTNSAGFMAASDLANLDNKKLSDSLAAEVVSGLKPFIANQLLTIKSSLTPVPTMSEQLGDALNTVKNIDSNIVKAAADIKAHSDKLTSMMNTNHESTIGYIDEVRESLGITDEPSAPKIAATLASLETAAKQGGGHMHQQDQEQEEYEPAPKTIKHSGNCNYQASGQPNILVCTLGCGSQVGVAIEPAQNSGSNQANTSHATSAKFTNPVQMYNQPEVSFNNNQGSNNRGDSGNRGNRGNRGNNHYRDNSYDRGYYNYNNNGKRKNNFDSAGNRVQARQQHDELQYQGVSFQYPTSGMQFITYPQQQPVLAGNPGIVHAQVYQGGPAQPVLGVQPYGQINALGQRGPN